MQDSNLQPRDYESPALTIVLTAHRYSLIALHNATNAVMMCEHYSILYQHSLVLREASHHTATFRAFALHKVARTFEREKLSEKCVSGV